MFYAKLPSKDDKPSQNLDLVSLSNIPIKRHVKIRNEATPYDHNFKEYFQERARKRTTVEKPDQSNGLKKA